MVMLLPLPTAITTSSPWSSAANAVTLFPGDTRIRHLPRSRSSAAPPSDQTPDRDPPGWAALIRRRARDGRPGEALALFREMVVDHRHKPDDLSITVVLGCCALLGAVGSGKEVHGFMVRDTGAKARTTSSESSLVGFYAKCGLLSRAREVFDRMLERDVVSWTIMLLAYAGREECQREMMALFVEMLCGGILPNGHTFTVVLSRATLEQGEQLHAHIVKRSWDSDAFVGSSLVDLYAKDGNLGGAQLVFDRIEHKDVVCYNSLISGYGRVGFVGGLISLFEEMLLVGLVPNQSSFVALLSGCANSGFMSPSKQFHAQVIVRGLESDQMIQGVVVDMYAKCGDLELARVAFDRIGVTKNIVVWNSMIDGYAKHGRTEEALQVFSLMEFASVCPDYITFICLLSACSHSGLVDEGWRLFYLMCEVYGIPAQNEHYCCMVDLLGRAGMVCEAYEFILKSKCEFQSSVWGALLSACRFLKDARIGEIAARRLFELEPKCSGSYVALAGIHAASGQWGVAAAVRELMDVRGIKKDPGYSWIEIDGMVHKFRAMEGIGGHNFMNKAAMRLTTSREILSRRTGYVTRPSSTIFAIDSENYCKSLHQVNTAMKLRFTHSTQCSCLTCHEFLTFDHKFKFEALEITLHTEVRSPSASFMPVTKQDVASLEDYRLPWGNKAWLASLSTWERSWSVLVTYMVHQDGRDILV